MSEEVAKWECGITLKRTSYAGATWTISVPADGEDHSQSLDFAMKQAVRAWVQLEEVFPAQELKRVPSVRE